MKCSIVLYEQYKFRKTKRAVEHTPFLKKIAACQSVCEIVKLSGFERPQISGFERPQKKKIVRGAPVMFSKKVLIFIRDYIKKKGFFSIAFVSQYVFLSVNLLSYCIIPNLLPEMLHSPLFINLFLFRHINYKVEHFELANP